MRNTEKSLFARLHDRYRSGSLKVAVLALLLMALPLPVIPDTLYFSLFNPYKTWAMTVIIASISFTGFLAVRFLGHRHGVFITGAAGGLISSTAVSVTLSKMFRGRTPLRDAYAAGVAVACTFMYLRVLLEVWIVDPHLATLLTPAYLAAALSGLAMSLWLYLHRRGEAALDERNILHDPLQLRESLRFGILFGIVYGAIVFVKTRYGEIGVYLVSLFSGVTDVDAVTLSLGDMAKHVTLPQTAAMHGIVIASVTNSLVKLGIVFWLGGRTLGLRMAQFFLLTLGLMGAALYATILYL